jgi:hypothetical protein
MAPSSDLFLGRSDKPETLRLDRANRHGVIAGAPAPARR